MTRDKDLLTEVLERAEKDPLKMVLSEAGTTKAALKELTQNEKSIYTPEALKEAFKYFSQNVIRIVEMGKTIEQELNKAKQKATRGQPIKDELRAISKAAVDMGFKHWAWRNLNENQELPDNLRDIYEVMIYGSD